MFHYAFVNLCIMSRVFSVTIRVLCPASNPNKALELVFTLHYSTHMDHTRMVRLRLMKYGVPGLASIPKCARPELNAIWVASRYLSWRGAAASCCKLMPISTLLLRLLGVCCRTKTIRFSPTCSCPKNQMALALATRSVSVAASAAGILTILLQIAFSPQPLRLAYISRGLRALSLHA